MKKIRLAIISEKTRSHFQKPLEYFKNIKIYHLFKGQYADKFEKNNNNFIEYHGVFDLYKKLKNIKPDIIQGMEPYYGYSRLKIPIKILPLLYITHFYSKKNKIPYFFHMLENINPREKYGWLAGGIMKMIARVYARGAKFIFYLNEGARKNLEILGCTKKIYYGLWGIWGVDTGEFKPKNIDWEKKKKNILFVGRLSGQKGILDLIDAIKLIVNENNKIDFKVSIVGNGELKEDIIKKIDNLNIQKYINIFGEISSSKIPAIYQDAYVTVLPAKSTHYLKEQVGMSNIESISTGVPVVSTFSGGISEYVINGKTGLLVPEGNIQKLAESIMKLLKNTTLRNQLSKNAREYALMNFDSKKNVEKLEKFIIDKLNNE